MLPPFLTFPRSDPSTPAVEAPADPLEEALAVPASDAPTVPAIAETNKRKRLERDDPAVPPSKKSRSRNSSDRQRERMENRERDREQRERVNIISGDCLYQAHEFRRRGARRRGRQQEDE